MISQLAALSIRFAEGSVTDINPDDVTPGVIGFAFTAVFAVAVIFIGVDMYRRIRRMKYREEVREEIANELAGIHTVDTVDDPEGTEASK